MATRGFTCYTSTDEARCPTAALFQDGRKTLCVEVEKVPTLDLREEVVREVNMPRVTLTIRSPRTWLDRLLKRDGLTLTVEVDDLLDIREMSLLLLSILPGRASAGGGR